MPNVCTGESKIFQLAAINPDLASKLFVHVKSNVPVLNELINTSIKFARMTCDNVEKTVFDQRLTEMFDTADLLTNNFLDEIDRNGIPWADAHAAWMTYQAVTKKFCETELLRRIAKE